MSDTQDGPEDRIILYERSVRRRLARRIEAFPDAKIYALSRAGFIDRMNGYNNVLLTSQGTFNLGEVEADAWAESCSTKRRRTGS